MSENISQALDKIFAGIDSGVSISDQMRQDEREAGRRVVVPGEVPWLSADDWDPSIVVSIDGRKVRLIAILAKKQGAGAFRRLIGLIQSSGLSPVVVEPTRELEATLIRWGWKSRRTGSGFFGERIMYPRPVILNTEKAG